MLFRKSNSLYKVKQTLFQFGQKYQQKFFSNGQKQQSKKVKIIIDSHFIRAQLNLTGVKPIWFSFGIIVYNILQVLIDSQTKPQGIVLILKENPNIKTVSIEQQAPEGNLSAQTINEYIYIDQSLYLKINETSYEFQNFKLVSKANFEAPSQIQPLEKIIDLFSEDLKDRLRVSTKQQFTQKELSELCTQSLRLFSNDILKKEQISIAVTLAEIRQELNIMIAIKKFIDFRAKRRTKRFFSLATSLIFTQLAVSYYGIYHVEWLGWDLLEPLTYTVSQGTFLAFLVYWLRSSKDSSYVVLGSDMVNSLKAKYYRKKDFDYMRFLYLQAEERRLQSQLDKLELMQINGFRKYQ